MRYWTRTKTRDLRRHESRIRELRRRAKKSAVVVMFFAFEPDLPGARGAALVGLAAGEPLFEHGGREDADLDEHLCEGVVLGVAA
jgi:hypothetical protein